jgi:OmpA-OmpF porin, OOP family
MSSEPHRSVLPNPQGGYMIKVGERLTGIVGALTVLTLATSGCASKKYVAQQIAPVNQRLNQYEKQTDERIAWLNNQVKTDVSQLNERIATTDQNVAQAAAAAQSAQGSASRAMDEADAVKAANTAAIENLGSGVANALNYQLIDKTDVLFGFNKSTLTPAARKMLDDVASKFESLPRGVVELAGFTDSTGAKNYNLELSRRRAWAVQRYLVAHNVPLRSIHMVGMGEEMAPEAFEAEHAGTEHVGKGRRDAQERRVSVRIYGAGDITSSGGGSQ